MAKDTPDTPGTSEDISEEIVDPPTIDSKYRLIILAAQRAKQLQRGALPRTEMDIRKHKATRVALKELQEKKVNFSFIESKEEKKEAAA